MIMDANDAIHLRMPGSTRAGMKADQLTEVAKNPMAKNDEFEKQLKEYGETAMKAGVDFKKANEVMNNAREQHQQYVEVAGAEKADILNDNWQKVNEALQYNIDQHRDGLTDYQITMLTQSEAGRKAIETGAVHIEGGMDAMIKMLEDKAPELAKKLREAGNVVKKQGGVTPPAGINIGVANFHIKQDFRDQDPDRIALVFKKELSHAATSRTMSRVATPFGL